MVQFLSGPKQELTGKIDVFSANTCIFACCLSKACNINFTHFLSDIDFTHLLCLRNEANYVITKRQHA